MTVKELSKALMYMDQDAEVLLNDDIHFMRRSALGRIEVDEANPVLEVPPVVLIAQEPPEIPWLTESLQEEHGY